MQKILLCSVACLCALFVNTSCPPPGGGTVVPYLVKALVADNAPVFGDVALFNVDDAGSNPVVDAVITVNGVVMPYIGANLYGASGTYSPGQSITIVVQKGDMNINETLTIPTQPSVSSPTAGSYNAASTIPVNWQNYTPDPTNFNVFIDHSYTNGGTDYDVTLAGSAASHILPGGTLNTAQTGVTVAVTALQTIQLTGTAVISGSYFTTSSTANSAAFNTN